jgi:hypothetical protein
MTRVELHENGGWKDITGQVADVEIRWGQTHERGDFNPGSVSTSLFAADMAAHLFGPMLAVKVEVPDGRWQELKARLKRVRGFGWLSVRMRWQTRFRGGVEEFRG